MYLLLTRLAAAVDSTVRREPWLSSAPPSLAREEAKPLFQPFLFLFLKPFMVLSFLLFLSGDLFREDFECFSQSLS